MIQQFAEHLHETEMFDEILALFDLQQTPSDIAEQIFGSLNMMVKQPKTSEC